MARPTRADTPACRLDGRGAASEACRSGHGLCIQWCLPPLAISSRLGVDRRAVYVSLDERSRLAAVRSHEPADGPAARERLRSRPGLEPCSSGGVRTARVLRAPDGAQRIGTEQAWPCAARGARTAAQPARCRPSLSRSHSDAIWDQGHLRARSRAGALRVSIRAIDC